MALQLTIWSVVSIISLAATLISWFTDLQPIIILQTHNHVEPQVPCYFIFGDSLVDNGNNNGLETTAKANYTPYGIDFPDGPTGRFCNGRNIADIIAELLGFDKFIPPFATARGQEILTGVNYGSGGAGIRDETGENLGARISLNEQLLNHHTTISRIAALIGSRKAAENYLSKCIYSVGMGSNDYINNYLQPDYYNTSRLYTPEQYAKVLIKQYHKQLRTLYKLRARKVAIFGLGFIGCTPAEMASYGTNGTACVATIDDDVQLFNVKLKSLVDELNNDLTDAEFIYINITEISSGNSSAAGITVTNVPCCNVTSNSGKGLCDPNQVPCSNRSIYAYWDAFHPTEASNVWLAKRAYTAQTSLDAYPFDISVLAQL